MTPLTDDQRYILWLFAQGVTYRQAARELGVSHSTLVYRVRKVFAGLRAANMVQAVHLATLNGYIGAYRDCGTYAAYQRHVRAGEVADLCCRQGRAREEAVYPFRIHRKKTPGIKEIR